MTLQTERTAHAKPWRFETEPVWKLVLKKATRFGYFQIQEGTHA